MKKFERGKINRNANSGFTLVELIVVLVILAILAAILVPALLGYIDKAREKKEILEAKNCLTAAQAELTELYAKYAPGTPYKLSVVPVTPEKKPNDNADMDLTENDFTKRVFETAGMTGADKPACFIIGMGSTVQDKSVVAATTHEKYTIIYAVYMKTPESVPLYYWNGSWTKENPRNLNIHMKNNKYKTADNKTKKIQYYVLAMPKDMYPNMSVQYNFEEKKGTTKNVFAWLRYTVDGR